MPPPEPLPASFPRGEGGSDSRPKRCCERPGVSRKNSPRNPTWTLSQDNIAAAGIGTLGTLSVAKQIACLTASAATRTATDDLTNEDRRHTNSRQTRKDEFRWSCSMDTRRLAESFADGIRSGNALGAIEAYYADDVEVHRCRIQEVTVRRGRPPAGPRRSAFSPTAPCTGSRWSRCCRTAIRRSSSSASTRRPTVVIGGSRGS